jgi:predicted porin
MRKLIALLTLTTGLLIATATVSASPAAEFEKGAVSVEFGSTLGSKVSGRGRVPADVVGEFGFKATATAGLNDHLAVQLKHGMFKSEESSILGLTTYAKAEPSDLNLLYKVNPNLTFITGYEHTKISYGNYVSDASKSSLHFGLTGTHKLNDKYTLFATLLGGKDVSLKEVGVSYKMSKSTTFNVSYAEREVRNVDLKVPLAGINGKENYTMKGVSCLFAFKL